MINQLLLLFGSITIVESFGEVHVLITSSHPCDVNVIATRYYDNVTNIQTMVLNFESHTMRSFGFYQKDDEQFLKLNISIVGQPNKFDTGIPMKENWMVEKNMTFGNITLRMNAEFHCRDDCDVYNIPLATASSIHRPSFLSTFSMKIFMEFAHSIHGLVIYFLIAIIVIIAGVNKLITLLRRRNNVPEEEENGDMEMQSPFDPRNAIYHESSI